MTDIESISVSETQRYDRVQFLFIDKTDFVSGDKGKENLTYAQEKKV